jgi:NAD(P)-dependent dehydrogenase (short-subunit alcohol dehydrogenase family)
MIGRREQGHAMMRFSGRVVMVTGGNSGIGRGIVHRFAAEGATVALVGRDPGKGRAVEAEVQEQGGEARFFACDLTRESEVEALMRDVESFGPLSIVVNNAGLGGRRTPISKHDGPGARWEKFRGPNLDATLYVSAHAMPVIARSGGGAIVNISSTATLHGNWGYYCVAKAAVEALTRSLAVEAAPHRIRVNAVSPGWISIDMDSVQHASGSADGSWKLPPSLLDRMGSPAEIAAAVAFLASDDASFITGQTLIVDGGLAVTDYSSLELLRSRGWALFGGTVS